MSCESQPEFCYWRTASGQEVDIVLENSTSDFWALRMRTVALVPNPTGTGNVIARSTQSVHASQSVQNASIAMITLPISSFFDACP
jgi:hypothetical protein